MNMNNASDGDQKSFAWLIQKADEALKQRKFTEAGRYYERAAAITDDKKKIVKFLKRYINLFNQRIL